MFAKLFVDAGLSLDRLRALVEVGATGSIAKAAESDPIKQSQYSRQIKELEDFFQTKLIERHGKGIRLTPGGRELARISRFFLMGLANFQRSCRAEAQVFHIGASVTFIDQFLLPLLAKPPANPSGPRYAVETASDVEIERRLHDLTLDFGIVTATTLSRPLQHQELGSWRLHLWVPRVLCRTEAQALQALKDNRLPLVLPTCETSLASLGLFKDYEPRLSCSSYLEAKGALAKEALAAFLPDFLLPQSKPGALLRVRFPALEPVVFLYQLAWNPRLLRLNPHASHQRDFLVESLATRMRKPEAAA